MGLLPGDERLRIPLPVERIHVEVTSRCNFDCEFCPQGDLARPLQDMPMAMLKGICDQLEGGRLAREIHFHVMGEPLLYRHLPEAVAYAGERGLVTVVTTNGSLLTSDVADALLAANLSRLVVSLQTPDDESFRIRGAGSLTFPEYEQRLRTSMRRLLGAAGSTEVVLAMRTTAYPRLQQPGSRLRIIDTPAELHAHLRRWIAFLLEGRAAPGELERLMAVAASASVARWNVLRATPRLVLETRPLGGWVKPRHGARFYPAHIGTCHALSEMFAVLASGDLTFCCMDAEGGTAVGNVHAMPLHAFFEHPEVLAAYRGFQSFRVVHPTCQRCLGEPGLLPSLGHQVGSILYQRFLRERLKKHIGTGA